VVLFVFMTNPNVEPSDEVRREAVTDFVIAEDWETWFSINGAGLRALTTELAEEQDPLRVMDLAPQKYGALVRTLGSGVLTLFKRDVIAGRNAFETQFGESY
jgi:hypothetical protein